MVSNPHDGPQALTGDELTLVSVIPVDHEMKLELGQAYQVHIGPDTTITFLSWRYRLSFTLDLSPSLMSVVGDSFYLSFFSFLFI